MLNISRCFVDESLHEALGVAVTAFVFCDAEFEDLVTSNLRDAGINTPQEEFKSSARMIGNDVMQRARANLEWLAASKTRIAVFIGPLRRERLGMQVLQALQSILLRNGIRASDLDVYFDNEIFDSPQEAARLHKLFGFLADCRLHAQQNSHHRVGIQVADLVAHSFGQIIKAALTGTSKQVDIGGPATGFAKGETAPLSWELLMALRHSLFTRPVISSGADYLPETDPVVLDPVHDDPVAFAQHPVLLGWGVQVAPEADITLRIAVEQELGQVWLGCIH